jgi:hypothetical protein
VGVLNDTARNAAASACSTAGGQQGCGHFPTEKATLECLYPVTRSLDPKGGGQTRWTMRWKPVPSALAITFADSVPAAEDR